VAAGLRSGDGRRGAGQPAQGGVVTDQRCRGTCRRGRAWRRAASSGGRVDVIVPVGGPVWALRRSLPPQLAGKSPTSAAYHRPMDGRSVVVVGYPGPNCSTSPASRPRSMWPTGPAPPTTCERSRPAVGRGEPAGGVGVHGASVLAAAGLLDGPRATTHWIWPRGSPGDTRRYTSTRHPSSCVTVRCRPPPVSPARSTLAFVEEDHRRRSGAAGGPRPGDLPAAAREPGPDEHVRRGPLEHDLVRDLVDTIAVPHGELGVAALRASPGQRAAPHPAVPRRARADAGPVYTSMASTSAPTPSGTSNQTQNSASDRGTTASRR
jgi:hypothetical protein